MYHPPLRHSFVAFHLILGAVVVLQSLIAVAHALHAGGARHENIALAGFASVEAVAALLFLIPATLRVGAWVLLLIFIFAIGFHGLHGEFQSTLLVYAAGVLLVLAHGHAFGERGPRRRVAT